MGALAEVEQARVHLTFPKDSVFLEARQPAKASVMVKLRPGAQLSPQNVQAVCHLVASAVEGLAPEVGLGARHARQPAQPAAPRRHRDDPLEASEASARLPARRSSATWLAKIRATLDPLLGARQVPGRRHGGLRLHERRAERGDLRPGALGDADARRRPRTPRRAWPPPGMPGTASNLPRAAASRLPPPGAVRPPHREHHLPDQPHGAAHAPAAGRRQAHLGGGAGRPGRALGGRAGRSRAACWCRPRPEKLKSIRDLVAGVVNFNQRARRPVRGGDAALRRHAARGAARVRNRSRGARRRPAPWRCGWPPGPPHADAGGRRGRLPAAADGRGGGCSCASAARRRGRRRRSAAHAAAARRHRRRSRRGPRQALAAEAAGPHPRAASKSEVLQAPSRCRPPHTQKIRDPRSRSCAARLARIRGLRPGPAHVAAGGS